MKRARRDNMAHPVTAGGRMRSTPNTFGVTAWVQRAIEKAEAGDFSLIHELLDLLGRPYKAQTGKEATAAK